MLRPCSVCLCLIVQVWLRAQRNAKGSGRLYRILYTAGNDAGSCSGVAYACVPLRR